MKLTADLARAIARDEGNRHMRQHNRDQWNEDDYNAACQTLNDLLNRTTASNTRSQS